MAHKSTTWLAQEIARLESLYAKRARDVARANSIRQALILAKVPSRPEMRALPLRGPKTLERALLLRLVALANAHILSLEKLPAESRQESATLILRDASPLEAHYNWLYRQLHAEVNRRLSPQT